MHVLSKHVSKSAYQICQSAHSSGEMGARGVPDRPEDICVPKLVHLQVLLGRVCKSAPVRGDGGEGQVGEPVDDLMLGAVEGQPAQLQHACERKHRAPLRSFYI